MLKTTLAYPRKPRQISNQIIYTKEMAFFHWKANKTSRKKPLQGYTHSKLLYYHFNTWLGKKAEYVGNTLFLFWHVVEGGEEKMFAISYLHRNLAIEISIISKTS